MSDSSETIKLKVWLVQKTEKAYLFSTTDASRDGKQVWIPRSMVEHISWQPEVLGEWRVGVITISEWLADKKGLL